MSTRIFARAALVGAGALALLGPLTAGTAAASAAGEQGGARVMAAPYAVVPYETVNVRYGRVLPTEFSPPFRRGSRSAPTAGPAASASPTTATATTSG
ncbi:hypothetical protein AB0E64_32895 [Streptomyces caelestis]|uniref:Uncharacterized protein n=1 Tax=Streptomyces caelestis TaxID=36816 RepID=A0A7W9HBZ7_9ACTN|nr:hypothetical protein [Streptomyces caelestis]MBB5799460.1 hypothetical protein [Streptomyces caelestis]